MTDQWHTPRAAQPSNRPTHRPAQPPRWQHPGPQRLRRKPKRLGLIIGLIAGGHGFTVEPHDSAFRAGAAVTP
ncbi:MAG: hypothetical protein ACRDT8_10150 [Micromonosporaceae bacterium]